MKKWKKCQRSGDEEQKDQLGQTSTHLFSEAIRYIRKDFAVNADKVQGDILTRINELSSRPEIHPPDKYREQNTGNYRAFELHRYRITHLVTDHEIIIARVRHTSQEPQLY